LVNRSGSPARGLKRLKQREVGITMRYRTLLGTSLALALLVGGALAAEGLKSGPQVGSTSLTPFHPLNINGDNAGQKFCQV
jgi:hypothetical protein